MQKNIIYNEENFKYLANNIIDISRNESKKVFGFTSSLSINNKKINDLYINIPKNIYEIILNKGIKIKLIDNSMLELDNIKLKENLDFDINNYDLIFVCISNILQNSESFECAKVCKNIILVEKYMYSYYKNYEKILFYLGQFNIIPRGVITVK